MPDQVEKDHLAPHFYRGWQGYVSPTFEIREAGGMLVHLYVCGTCSAVVETPILHAEWHADQVGAPPASTSAGEAS